MLTKADEYPFHQTPDPMAYSGTDRNFYDRYFFNGRSPDGAVFFAMALGVYPQLNIMDGSFCVVTEGKQHILRVSKHMHGERAETNIGPLSLTILEPLHSSRLRLESNDGEVTADVTFTVRHDPIEEPRFVRRVGTRAVMDYTRLTQNVAWEGTITIGGKTIEVTPDGWWGTRDRSWGIRSVGLPDSQPPYEPQRGQFFWLWTPMNFEDCVAFSHTNDDENGLPWNRRSVIQELNGEQVEFDKIEFDYTWRDKGNRIDTVTCRMSNHDEEATMVMKTGTHFYMTGLGYVHPEWGHGYDKGELAVLAEVIDFDDFDDASLLGIHVQALTEVELTYKGKTRKGHGVVEQLFFGEHPALPKTATTLV